MEPTFSRNEIPEAPSYSMRVFQYGSGAVNRQNPYYRYIGRFNRHLTQNVLEKLLEAGNVIKDSDVTVETHPELCKRELKPHQKRLVYEMKQLENSPYCFTHRARLGFLCDAVGTGKSLSLLSLIMENRCPTGGSTCKVPYTNPITTYSESKPYLPAVFHPSHPSANYRTMNSTLIVVPHTIFSQWKRYIESDTNLKVCLVYSKKTLHTFVDTIESYVEHPDEAPDVVLCKSTMYNILIDSIEALGEAYVNSVEMKRYECQEESSVDYSIIRIPDMVQHVRSSSRQLSGLLYGYRRGVESVRDVAEGLNDLTDYLVLQQNMVQQLMSYTTDTSGQLVEHTMIPKSGLLWNRVILDEADTIPISASKAVMARMIWMVSASFHSFLYPYTSPPPHRTGFIRTLMESQKGCYFYMQHCMFTSTREALQESFPLLPPETQEVACLTPNHIRVAQRSCMSDVVDALNAGDTERAMQMCHCNTESSESGLIESLKRTMEEQLVAVERKIERVERHSENAQSEIERTRALLAELGPLESITSPEVIDSHSSLLESLRVYTHTLQAHTRTLESHRSQRNSIRSRLESMSERMEEVMSQNCPICMEEIQEGKRAVVSCCHQTFCVDCMLQQLAVYRDRTTPCPCPMCRATLTPQSFTVLRTAPETPAPETPTLPTKEEALIQLVSGRNDNKRFLLFSGHDTTFRHLEPLLERKQISFRLLNGSDGSVQKKIKQWEEGKTRVLCLNSTVLGAGMNLPQATDVIVYHKQLPDLEEQVIGRAQRPGRTSTEPLRVWKLSYEGEYSSE